MWIAITNNPMSLALKHQDRDVLHNLAWISLYNFEYTTLSIDTPDPSRFVSFTEPQLKNLYKSITGKQWSYYNFKALLETLHRLVTAAPCNIATPQSASLQAANLTEKHRQHGGVWHYAHRATRATLKQGAPLLNAKIEQSEIDFILKGNWPSLKPLTRDQEADVVKAKIAEVLVKPYVEKPNPNPQKLKNGSVTKAIWDKAYARRKELGDPCDEKSLNLIRKELTTILIDAGVNENTINSQLYRWKQFILTKSLK